MGEGLALAALGLVVGVGGALATATDMAVLDAAGTAIAGLYAAGDAAAWLEYAGGHGYGISWATTSGRLAGAAGQETHDPGDPQSAPDCVPCGTLTRSSHVTPSASLPLSSIHSTA